MSGPPKSKAPPDGVATEIAEREALDLRARGLTYTAIAAVQGVDPSTAWRRVSRALERHREEVGEAAAELREMELRRLDVATRAVMPRVEEGDDKAIASLVRVMERRAKLLGLDDPTRHEVAVTDDPREPIRRLLEEGSDDERAAAATVARALAQR